MGGGTRWQAAWLTGCLWLAAATPPVLGRADEATEERGGTAGARAYRIGVRVSAAGDALVTQLKLPPGQGLLVDDVLEESPADAAGVQAFDVLVAADGEPLSAPDDLQDVLSAAGGDGVVLDVIRGGEPHSLAVTPRPVPPREDQGLAAPLYFSLADIPDAAAAAELPDDVDLTVVKHGSSPARVTVVRGETTWHLTEETLHHLPEDLYEPVARYAGGAGEPLADVIFSNALNRVIRERPDGVSHEQAVASLFGPPAPLGSAGSTPEEEHGEPGLPTQTGRRHGAGLVASWLRFIDSARSREAEANRLLPTTVRGAESVRWTWHVVDVVRTESLMTPVVGRAEVVLSYAVRHPQPEKPPVSWQHMTHHWVLEFAPEGDGWRFLRGTERIEVGQTEAQRPTPMGKLKGIVSTLFGTAAGE